MEWASANNLTLLYNPKEPDSFHSAPWNSGTNRDLAFASNTEDQPSPIRLVLEKFPRPQHWPSLITQVPPVASTSSKPVRRWNFRKADWDKFKLLTNTAFLPVWSLKNMVPLPFLIKGELHPNKNWKCFKSSSYKYLFSWRNFSVAKGMSTWVHPKV